MENRLHRSEKMEALGLLAGGVAHDLNNILSGLVSYPELLLMNPETDFRTFLLDDSHGQKAIITSGFSENDRVREAHRLGASQYAISDIITWEDCRSRLKAAPTQKKGLVCIRRRAA